jgi:outer membrane protein assembly factor BamB
VATNLVRSPKSGKTSVCPGFPDGEGGALVSWVLTTSPGTGHVTHVTSSSSTDLSISDFGQQMVLGDNGTAFANGGTTVTAFNLDTMSTIWTFQRPANAYGMGIIASSAGGGLVLVTADQNNVQTVVRLDANGQPTADSWSGNGLNCP